tara:strand:+ start:710 stop:1390 length:681 start_codon:yes stop_codon:yes gene_type:complete
MNQSESIKAIAPALLAAQKAIKKVSKTADNPYFKSKYADLVAVIDATKKPLNDNDIVFLQAVGGNGDGPYVETVLLHTSGEWVSTQTPIYCKKPDDPQAFGSGVTYSKRYALQALLGLPSEDDDGEAAVARDKAEASPDAETTTTREERAAKPDENMANEFDVLLKSWAAKFLLNGDAKDPAQKRAFVTWAERKAKLKAGHLGKTENWDMAMVEHIRGIIKEAGDD